jgi:hypothetical protein
MTPFHVHFIKSLTQHQHVLLCQRLRYDLFHPLEHQSRRSRRFIPVEFTKHLSDQLVSLDSIVLNVLLELFDLPVGLIFFSVVFPPQSVSVRLLNLLILCDVAT